MKENHKETINNVFIDVLMNFAFMFGDVTAQEDLPETLENFTITHMAFSGDKNGFMSLATPAEMGKELSENVIGEESSEGTDETIAFDSLKELLNITCGNVLSNIFGDRAVFDMHAPTINKIGLSGWENFIKPENSLCFMIDEYPVVISFNIDGE